MERFGDKETRRQGDSEIRSQRDREGSDSPCLSVSSSPCPQPSLSSTLPLMIVAGEASGDKHGAKLVSALRESQPDLRFEVFGAGGDEMRQAGVETLVDAREVAIMGALEVARAMPKFLRVFRQLSDAANDRRPRLIVLIDWPEFNLRLAKRLKR